MKEVNIKNVTNKVHPQYLGVEQPMRIYHSTKEFIEHEAKSIPQPKVITDIASFQRFLVTAGIEGKLHEFINLFRFNVWIATNEQFVPDTQDYMGQIIYMLKDGKPIPTDNCYIHLYSLYAGKGHYNLFTSSGVYDVSLTHWKPTAGTRNKYCVDNTVINIHRYKETYEERLRTILDKKRFTSLDYKLFNQIFNPMSSTFLDFDKSVLRVYGTRIRKEDREKIIECERFRNLIIKEFAVMMPELQKTVREKIPAGKMADYLSQIFDKSIEKGTTEQQLSVWDKIAQIAYGGANSNTNGVVLINGNNGVGQLPGSPNPAMIEQYNDEDSKIPITVEDATPKETVNTKDIASMLKKREDVGTMSGYVETYDEEL